MDKSSLFGNEKDVSFKGSIGAILTQALNSELRKTDLADFFYENRAGN